MKQPLIQTIRMACIISVLSMLFGQQAALAEEDDAVLERLADIGKNDTSESDVITPTEPLITSTCYGTPSKGQLENGVKMPASGKNFSTYSQLGHALGRTYVHSSISTVIQNTFNNLAKDHPHARYKIGESGLKNGGEFYPHRTHQNGTSVDFMSPVVNAQGQSIWLPTNVLNKFGYGMEFDENGRKGRIRIDFEALAVHLLALDAASKKQGIKIKRVIFAPELRKHLFKTRLGKWLKQRVPFMPGKAWVRHDEHYHVDFDIPCQPLANAPK